MSSGPPRKEQLSVWVACSTRAAYDELGGNDNVIHFNVPACRKPRCESRGEVCVLRVQNAETKVDDWQVWHESCLMDYIKDLDEKQRQRMSSVNEAALRKCACSTVFQRPVTNALLRAWPDSQVKFLACAAVSQSEVVPHAITYANGDRVRCAPLPLHLMFMLQADLPLASSTSKLPQLRDGIPCRSDGTASVAVTRHVVKYLDAEGDMRHHCIVTTALSYPTPEIFQSSNNRLLRAAERSTPEMLRSNVFESDAELTQLHHALTVYVARMTGSVDHARVEQALSFSPVHNGGPGRGVAYLRCTPGSQTRFLVGAERDVWLVKPNLQSMLVPFLPTGREVQEGRGTDFDIVTFIPARDVLRTVFP